MLERVRRHHTEQHPRLGFEYQELSRDQVVSIITRQEHTEHLNNLATTLLCQLVSSVAVFVVVFFNQRYVVRNRRYSAEPDLDHC